MISRIIEVGWFAKICLIIAVEFGDNPIGLNIIPIGLNIIRAYLPQENVTNTVQSPGNNELYSNINWGTAKWHEKN